MKTKPDNSIKQNKKELRVLSSLIDLYNDVIIKNVN